VTLQATVPASISGRVTPSGRKSRRSALPGIAFILPGVLLYALIVLWPAVEALIISFKRYRVRSGLASPGVGLANYTRAFHDPVAIQSFVNSAVYMLLSVPPQIVLGLVIALLLDKAMPGRTFFRVLFYIPVITSWVVVSLLFLWLFNTDQGVFNWILSSLGLVHHNIDWLGNRWSAMLAISVLGAWKGVGWAMLIILASLAGVSDDLHEAAAIDGAGTWSRFRYVTLPHIRSTLATVTILLVMGGFNVFPSVYLMTGGGPADQTQVPLTYIYKQAFTYLDFGYGSALSYLLAFFIVVITLIQYWIARRIERGAQ